MEFIYNEVDITGQTSILRVELEQYLNGHIDTITAVFDDSAGDWSKWRPAVGDRIQANEGYAKSGTMYIHSLEPRSNAMSLKGTSLKYLKTGHTKRWNNVSFLQLLKIRAQELGLTPEYYGITDQTYDYVEQDGGDLAFLDELCRLEGCGFMINNGVIRFISLDYLESMDVSDYTLDAYNNRNIDLPYYTGAVVTDGTIEGKAGNDRGERVRLTTKQKLQSISEANRFAENVLKYANTSRKTGVVYMDQLLSEFAPGSKVYLNCDYWQKKPVIITRIRHDLYRMKSKVFFRLTKEN